MKTFKYLLIISVFILITGCSMPEFIRIEGTISTPQAQTQPEKPKVEPVDDYFDQLYPILMDKTVASINYPSSFLSIISKKDKIIITAIDRASNAHNDLQNVVERGLLKSFLGQGFNIYERGNFTIPKAYLENSKKIYKPFSGTDSLPSATVSYDFTSADIMIAYRILEFGIVKIPEKDGKTTKRIGRVSLELRAIDVKTLKLLACEVVDGKSFDQINNDIDIIAQDFHYKPFTYALPLVQNYQSNPVLNISSAKEEPTKKNQSNAINNPDGYNRNLGVKIYYLSGNDYSESTFKVVDVKSGLTIAIFNVGKESTPGTKIIEWDCKNTMGQLVPGGPYKLVNANNQLLANFYLNE